MNDMICLKIYSYMIDLIKSSILLIIGLITDPISMFKSIQKGTHTKEIYFTFSIGAVIVFLKSLVIRNEYIEIVDIELLNTFFSFLSIGIVRCIVVFLLYFILIYCISFICGSNKKRLFKLLALSLMSLSGIGILVHAIFLFIIHIFNKEIWHVIFNLFYFWILVLSIHAIKETYNVTFKKASIAFLKAFIPMFIFFGYKVVTPYIWFVVYM